MIGVPLSEPVGRQTVRISTGALLCGIQPQTSIADRRLRMTWIATGVATVATARYRGKIRRVSVEAVAGALTGIEDWRRRVARPRLALG
ncbi:MAG: hypothetical protein KME26_29320 [Oscillatoria princeps RMCB-10]|nr:hypothetical protein [Oscillatoria princeps RMCB-10]